MTSFITSLEDGTSVHLRPVIPEDRGRIAAGVRQLSPDSRYYRFFNAQPALGEEHLHKLTEVDQHHHVAWMALVPGITGEAGIGVGRFVRDKSDLSRADLALTVVDAWQHRGVGTLLLALLCIIARKKGVRAFCASVLPENRHMIEWFLRTGASECLDDGLCKFHFKVPGGPGQPASIHTELHSAMDKISTAIKNSIPPPPHSPGTGSVAISTNL